ncbi:MAG: hypothetical protein DI536_28315 [Archangium gephyra]|uniref:Lipoprotein n=1 Tax=Archangium gephyra TaxID=48 RepID=A0A2W5T4Q4_9BACT|nr:MAG: hypothetical protein DI536_28315 [Archangium gephyra]
MRTLVLVMLTVSVAGCRCGPLDEGSCTGTWGGTTLNGATLDAVSRMVIVRRTSCLSEDTHVYALSWGNGAVTSNFSLNGNQPTVLTEKNYALPPTGFLTFSVTPEPPAPEGTLTLGIRGLEGDRTGTLHLKNATEEMTCTFGVSYETEGTRISCGGSGDGD